MHKTGIKALFILLLTTSLSNAQEVTVGGNSKVSAQLESVNANQKILNNLITTLNGKIEELETLTGNITNCAKDNKLYNTDTGSCDEEVDPKTMNFAKKDIPTCPANQVLTSTDGQDFTCTAASSAAPITHHGWRKGSSGTVNLGPRKFCAIGRYRSDSEDDGSCEVYKHSNGNWYFRYSQQRYVWCAPICMD